MGQTLLYIDPDPGIRLLVRKGLKPAGVTVLEAESPARARQIAEQTSPDAVLIDVDGIDTEPGELVRSLRQSPGLERALLLASTAEDRPDRVKQATASGFDGVFVKPLDIDVLVEELKARLPKPEASQPPEAAQAAAAADTAQPAAAALRAEVPNPRWLSRLELAPFIKNLVRTVSIADGAVALVDAAGETLILIAAYSVRAAGKPLEIGTRVTLNTASWLQTALRDRQPAIVDPAEIGPSPLIPEGTTAVLVVPVAAEARVYGVVVLGERRRRTFAFPPAQVAESVTEAGRITAVLQAFDRLDESLQRTRQDIQQLRFQAARALPTAGQPEAAETVRAREALKELSLGLAQRLKLPFEDVEALEQAVDVHDLGRTWIAETLLPHVTLPPEDRQALVDTHLVQTNEMLRVLEVPPEVRELVRHHRAPWKPGAGSPAELPLGSRILAVATAFQALTTASGSGAPLSEADALAEIRRGSGTRFDPVIVEALSDLVGQDGRGETTAGFGSRP